MDSHNRLNYHQRNPGHRLKGFDEAIGLRYNPGSFWLSQNLGIRLNVLNHTPVSQTVHTVTMTVSEIMVQVKCIKPHTSGQTVHTVTMNNKTAKSTFLNQAKMFVALLVEMGNLYMKISADLQCIDSRAIIDAAVAATVGTIKVLSKDRYGKFTHV